MAFLVKVLKHDKINPIAIKKTKRILPGRNVAAKVIGPRAK